MSPLNSLFIHVNFWKTVKPFFSKKCNSGDQNIILCEDNKIINDTCEVSEKINTFFSTVADKIGELGIKHMFSVYVSS
jgi:acetylglutamate synthase